MSDLSELFFQECDDLLEGLNLGLNELENKTGDKDTVNSMFRAVHSIKGGAGAFGLDQLVSFAHVFENVMDLMRDGTLPSDDNLVALLFSAADHLSDLVAAARNGETLPDDEGASILSDLKLMAGDGHEEPEVDEASFMPLTLDIGGSLPGLDGDEDDDPDEYASDGSIGIRFRAFEALYTHGHDPALLFRALDTLGELSVTADLAAVVPLKEGESWQTPELSWHLTLVPDTGIDESAVREVFEFVDGHCELEIGPSASLLKRAAEAVPVAGAAEASAEPSAPAAVAAGAPMAQSAAEAAVVADLKTAKPQPVKTSTIRVDLQRVDRLINLVGELVISEAMLRQSMSELQHSASSAVEEAMSQLKQLSGFIQESVMAIRAQPVNSLFQRMARIVRETSREAGKQAKLVTVGDATEVDKTVIERLVDPLTHMIRNAVDHGLETPQVRESIGKEGRGTVTLEAAHRSGRVVITLRDDGAGINRPKVREIAEQKGLVQPEDDLTDADIDNLLFRAGFSTATEVSNLSGRGVGMDVVRNEIQALGGRVTLSSEPGKGTAVTISLPLTLAVLEGMIVRVDDQTLVVPTLALREMLQPGQAQVHHFCEDDRVLSLNGELVPIIDLGTALGFRAEPPDIDKQSLLLIEAETGRRSALAVDGIAEQREVVIKGLDANYREVPGIAAATILGDGKIALIVDTDQMIAFPATATLAERAGLEGAIHA